jgi:hypothetical protein
MRARHECWKVRRLGQPAEQHLTRKNSLDFSLHTAGKVSNIHFVHLSTAASSTSQACGKFTAGWAVSDAPLAGDDAAAPGRPLRNQVSTTLYTLTRLSDKDYKIYPHKKNY